MSLNDEPKISPPFYSSRSCPSDPLDADFPAFWAPRKLDENGLHEDFSNLTDFPECLLPNSPPHVDDLVGDNYETSADSEDCFVIDNTLPHPVHRGWSPDTFASQEKSDHSYIEETQIPDDPNFTEVQPLKLRCLLRLTFLRQPWIPMIKNLFLIHQAQVITESDNLETTT